MKKGIILLIMSLLSMARAGAQYYDTGQDPASLRWLQIRTPHFRVIYPDDFGEEAGRYALLLEESFEKLSVLYPGVKTNIPVIIHNHSMQSNGYVSWAPRRMELYPLPGQDNLPMHPAAQLAVHETTHVLQLGSLYSRGFGKALRYLIGEQAVGLGALEIPSWAFEGDAVYAETAAGLSGRGRSNTFIRGAMALTLRPEGIYGYDKMLSGSYRNFTPDHYVFGYLMMNHIRTIDPGAWNEVYRIASAGFSENPVNAGLRRETGLTKKRLYDSTFAALEKAWRENMPAGITDYASLSKGKKRDYVSHFTPHRMPDGRIISLRTSMSDPSRFVITDPAEGKELNVTTTGYVYPYIFSFSGNTVVWAEQYPDIRWDNRDYSVIKRLDIPDGTVTAVTWQTRYTAPDLSPDGRTIAAVSTTPELRCSLVFLDAWTGEVLMNVVPPENLILQRPAWSSDGSNVTVVTLNGNGEGIRTYRPTGKVWTVNMEENVTDIVQAEIHNDTLFFLAQGDGSDNIYRIAGDEPAVRITGSRFGISGFSVSGNEVLFSDYTAGGYIIASEKTNATAGPAMVTGHEIFPPVAPMPGRAQGAEPPAETDSDTLRQLISEPRPYRKAAHLFNFHSWFPFYADIDEIRSDPTTIRPGITLLSQNHLSTLVSNVGYEYSDGNHYLHSGITWKGWHPVIDADVVWGGDQIIIRDTSVSQLPEHMGRDLQFNLNVYDQMWFAYGKFRQMLMPALYFNYRNRYTWIPDENRFDPDLLNITGRLYFSNTFRTAYRDINPRWGQVFDFRLTTAPWDTKLYNRRSYTRTTFFFPGVLPNHSLALRAGWENQGPARKLLYRNSIPWPRGYNGDLVAEKLFSFSADYTMPLFYPDLAAGTFFYLKRVRGTLFYDHTLGERIHDFDNRTFTAGKEMYNSLGSELMADFYVLRFPFEISAGVRGGYIPGENRFFVNGAFSVNIYGTVLGRER
ncbi:MAG: WD40 repeat domain-containing protein [Bacteroidota bacterium]|nr:WD40 repeat domain-containing protein [Bacteroidota bacterium]